MNESHLHDFLENFPEWESYGTPLARAVAEEILRDVLAVPGGGNIVVFPSDHEGRIEILVRWGIRELMFDIYPDDRPVKFLLSLDISELEGEIGPRFSVTDLMGYLMM